MCKPDKRGTYLYCKESKLVQIVLDHIESNADYKECVSRILDHVRIKRLVDAATDGNGDIDTIPDAHDRSFNDDWLPP